MMKTFVGGGVLWSLISFAVGGPAMAADNPLLSLVGQYEFISSTVEGKPGRPPDPQDVGFVSIRIPYDSPLPDPSEVYCEEADFDPGSQPDGSGCRKLLPGIVTSIPVGPSGSGNAVLPLFFDLGKTSVTDFGAIEFEYNSPRWVCLSAGPTREFCAKIHNRFSFQPVKDEVWIYGQQIWISKGGEKSLLNYYTVWKRK